jgi:thiol:disulfide interchange protein DsbA
MQAVKRSVLILLLSLFSVSSFAAEFKEGVDYQRLKQELPTDTKGKVEVREFFWYGCPHCHRFEPFIERWLARKPEQAEFIRTPAAMVPHWQIHARAFYTAEVLGVLDQIHRPLFDAIHIQRKKINTDEALANFFQSFGVEKAKFYKTFRSFAVETRFRRAKTLAMRAALEGVPAVIVNGKYLVKGNNARTLKVINHLVKMESGA